MSEPTSKEQYETKYHENTKISGFGIETATHMPCPGCAESDLFVAKILEVEETMAKEHVCKHCRRGFKTIFERSPNEVKFEVVQTQGPDMPPFVLKLRRVSVEEETTVQRPQASIGTRLPPQRTDPSKAKGMFVPGIQIEGKPPCLRLSTAVKLLKQNNAPAEDIEQLEADANEVGRMCPVHGRLEDPIIGITQTRVVFACPFCSGSAILALWEAEGKAST